MTNLRSRLDSTIESSAKEFEKQIGLDIYNNWTSIHEFISDVHLNWFEANWRVKKNRANSKEETLFLMLHNARADLSSAVDSFADGFIRGPSLQVKSALIKISAAIVFSKDDKLMDEFFKDVGMSKKLVKTAGKNYREISDLYEFLEKKFTHDVYASFAGPFAVRDCKIDDHLFPPWIDHYLGYRWGITYCIHSALLILAQFSDLFFHRGTNLWSLEGTNPKTVNSVFHEHIAHTKKRWEEVNDYLEKKDPRKNRVFTF